MAENNSTSKGVNGSQILVRGTVILRIPDLDTDEVTALYRMVQEIVDKFGGEFDVSTSPQLPQGP